MTHWADFKILYEHIKFLFLIRKNRHEVKFSVCKYQTG